MYNFFTDQSEIFRMDQLLVSRSGFGSDSVYQGSATAYIQRNLEEKKGMHILQNTSSFLTDQSEVV